jgi:hypothetical protein
MSSCPREIAELVELQYTEMKLEIQQLSKQCAVLRKELEEVQKVPLALKSLDRQQQGIVDMLIGCLHYEAKHDDEENINDFPTQVVWARLLDNDSWMAIIRQAKEAVL